MRNDYEMKEFFFKMLDLSSLFIVSLFQEYVNSGHILKQEDTKLLNRSKDPLFNLQQVTLDSLKEELFDDFLQAIFGEQPGLDKESFVTSLVKINNKYLTASFIRHLIIDKLIM